MDDMVPQVIDKINSIFNDDYLNKTANETGFMQRKRKIMPRQFLENIIKSTLTHPKNSLEDLASEFETEELSVSKQALHKKINLHAVEFIKMVLESLLQVAFSTHELSLKAIPCINDVIVGDSSIVGLDQSLKNQFPGQRNQGASIKIQSIMSVMNNQIKSLEITPATEPDQGYRKHLDYIQENNLWLGDLGYFSLDTFNKIIEKKAFFLSRYFRRTKLFYPTNGEIINLRSLLTNTSENTMEFDVILGIDGVPCRCVAIRLNEKEYQRRLKNLEEKRRKDGRINKKNYIDILDQWTILITNLPIEVECNILWCLYMLRWQIELLFKMMKTFLNLRKIEQSNYSRSMVSIYSSMIAMVLLTLTTMTIIHEEISLYKACKLFTKHIRSFFEYLGKQEKVAVSWLREKICRFALKETRLKRPSTRRSLGWEVVAHA